MATKTEMKQKDIKIERKVLHLMLNHESAIDSVIEFELDWDDFVDEYHQQIFAELLDLYRNNEFGGISLGSNIEYLIDALKAVFEDVAEINNNVNRIKTEKCELKYLSLYINELHEYTRRRKIIAAHRKMADYLRDNAETATADELANLYDSAYQEVFADVISTVNSESTAELTERTLQGIIEEIETPSAVKFGLAELDQYAKFLSGYLTYIAGDTGIGKTTVATYLATSMANSGKRVLVVNLETSSDDCLKKLISSCIDVGGHRIKYTRLINPTLMSNKDWDVIEAIAEQKLLNDFGIYWIYKPDMTVDELQREITRHVRMYDIDVVIGDYYQLLRLDESDNDYEGSTIPKVSRRLMTMAGLRYLNNSGKRKKIVHIWLSQINKDVQHRQNKRPTKDDLHFGGARDARLVLGIYRDEYYNEETEKPGIIELGILKQNMGIANEWFDYIFDTQYQTIRDMTDEEKELIGGEDDEDNYEEDEE